MKHKTLKNDIIAIGLCLLLAGIAFLCLFLFRQEGASVKITAGKEVVGEYSLFENRTVTLAHNVIVIENGKVRMESADCPDHLCVKKGEKSLTRQTIVCLPNEVVVEIIGASEGDVDFTQGGGVLP